MRLSPLLISVMILSGCERGLDGFVDWLSGSETNTVILSGNELTIGPSGKEFDVADEAKVVGGSASVCVPLRGNFPIQEQGAMDAEYERLLHGVALRAHIETYEGRKVSISRWGQSWSRYGKIFDRDELAACVHIDCAEAGLELGTRVRTIAIFASDELKIEGAYWESTNAWDNVN